MHQRILEVTNVESGEITRVGMMIEREDCAKILQEAIYEDDPDYNFTVKIYEGVMPMDRDDEEVERSHKFGQLLSLKMGWA